MKIVDIVGSIAVGFAVGATGSATLRDPCKSFPDVPAVKVDKCINTVPNAYSECVNENAKCVTAMAP